MSRENCEQLRTKLLCRYEGRIIVRIGTAEKPIYNAEKEYDDRKDIAIYIHADYEIAVVWNLLYRREKNKVIKCFSVSQSWDEIKPDGDEINDIYKCMKKNKGDLEKVIVLGVDPLSDIMDDLFSYLQENINDPHRPGRQDGTIGDIDLQERGRHTVTQWNREVGFRNKVLQRYGKKCAICRCDEEDILEAAHIRAVSDRGPDKETNGICLCANHHRMLDKNHIKIDYVNHRLVFVGDKVKKMAWYQEFIKKYHGMLLCPNT